MNSEQLHAARLELVRKYHAHPAFWPDGIESRYDRWYTSNKAYWDALARGEPVTTVPVTTTAVTTPVTTAKRDRAEYMRRYRAKQNEGGRG